MKVAARVPVRVLVILAWMVLAGPGLTPLPGQGRPRAPDPGPAPAASSGLRRAQEAPGVALPVVKATLANGMRILILPRPGAPIVSFVVRFAVGGIHEHLGTTGTAHLLEHMLFKGTTTIGTRDHDAERPLFAAMDAVQDTLLLARAARDSTNILRLPERIRALEDSARAYVVPNEFDRILTRAGARGLNATTSNESTHYFVELPANRLELWFALEADRMAHPVFREFYTERDVVMEERRMRIEASPGGFLYENHLATAFTMHPYGVPVVGYMSDLQNLTRRDVASYYRKFYGAANAVVTLVGDVDPDAVLALAKRYFAPLDPGETPPPVLAVEPRQRGERRIRIEWDAEPQLRMGWHVPDLFHEDAPALAVLTTLLTGGRTSRLHRRLVTGDRLATGVFSSVEPGSLFPRLFSIDATPRSPHTPADVEAAVYEELERLARDGPTSAELERVRNRLRAGSVRRLQSNLGLAFQLSESEALFGDWRRTFRLTARLAAVTPEDIRRVVRAYFTPENRTVAVLGRGEGS
ncbi:MAG: M16 family metallopeptidase [Gemmatimonadota bacterium]